MKDLIIVNGTMGVGKTTTCRALMNRLQPCAYLDGDWCWTMKPFVVSEENKRMELDNIGFVLSSFLANSGYRYIFFSWVLDFDTILHDLLSRLQGASYRLRRFTLVCSAEALRQRLSGDIRGGLRDADIIERSLERRSRYDAMDTIKIDVSACSPEAAADEIARWCGGM